MIPSRNVLSQGTIAGCLGYLASILYFAVLNLIQGRSPLFTVTSIGRALFGDPAGPEVGAVIAYNGLHLLLFILVGIVAAWVLHELELHPAAWYAALMALIVAFVFASTVFAALVAPLAAASLFVILIGNLLAAVTIAIYLARTEPGLARRIELQDDPQ